MPYTEREQEILDYINNSDAAREAMMRAGAAASALTSLTEIMSGSEGGFSDSGVLEETYRQAIYNQTSQYQAEPIFQELNEHKGCDER